MHSTAGDTKQLDTGEVTRARHLAEALKADGSVSQLAFNSAAAEPEHGVKRIAQKHDVEAVLAKELPTTHLRANLFMEELWKSYTRPGARLASCIRPRRPSRMRCPLQPTAVDALARNTRTQPSSRASTRSRCRPTVPST